MIPVCEHTNLELEVKSEVKQGEGLIRELAVTIPAEKVNSELEKKFVEIRKDATIKGFRKGKAPMDRIKAEFGPQVKADVVEELIRSTYPEIVKEHDLKPAAYPTVTHVDFTDEGAFEFTAEIEVFPEVETVVFDGMEVKLPKVEVADKDVDEFIEVMRTRMAEFRPVDRAATAEDQVLLNLKKLEDPNMVLAEDIYEGQEVDLTTPGTVNEFKEQLPGMTAKDEKEIEVSYPEDYPDATFAGNKIKYLVHMVEVRERLIPEFDDAFAKASGQAETALELRMKIRDELKQRIEQNHDRDRRGQIIEQMNQKNEIPVPEALVDNYLERVVNDFKERYQDADEADIKKSYRDVGIKTIRWNMLYNRLADQEKIEVSQDDVENRIKKFADNYGMTVEDAKQQLARSGTVADIKDSIREEKVLNFLADKASVTETEPEKKEE